MSNDMYSIVERLAVLEGRVTPTSVKSGLNKQQQSVPQLPALFKPRHISVLGSKKDPQHPMAGYAVGASESVELEESDIAEEMLGKVKKSFADYLQSIEDQVKGDKDIQDRRPDTKEVQPKKADAKDLKLKNAAPEISNENLIAMQAQPVAVESAPVKTIECGPGMMFEIHGDEHNGFEVRHGSRSLKSRFENLDHAVMACEMFKSKLNRGSDESADYIEER
jgi:hypothetical protein